jgi:hypothetical protein
MTGLLTKVLAGRTARCYCGRTATSSYNLAFFEYCGEGSNAAGNCECGYAKCAHEAEHMATLVRNRDGSRRKTVVETGHCTGFRERGDLGHDRFYCGCRGWD